MTRTRWQRRVTMSILCSISRKVTPRALISRMRSMMTSSSVALTPAAGSSSRMISGSAIITRASSSNLRWPPERMRAGSSAKRAEPQDPAVPWPCLGRAFLGGDTRGVVKLAHRRSPLWPWRASSMLSNSDSSGNGRGIWKVRPMPPAKRRWAADFVTSCPISLICPDVAATDPASRSNIVVLPAPFGPIRPRISPEATEKDI